MKRKWTKVIINRSSTENFAISNFNIIKLSLGRNYCDVFFYKIQFKLNFSEFLWCRAHRPDELYSATVHFHL